MKAAIKSFSGKVAKSLDPNNLKYVSESEIDSLLETINPNNKTLLKVNDSYISKTNLENYLYYYMNQDFLNEDYMKLSQTDSDLDAKYQPKTWPKINQGDPSINTVHDTGLSGSYQKFHAVGIKNGAAKSIANNSTNSNAPHENRASSKLEALDLPQQAHQYPQNKRQNLNFTNEKLQKHFDSVDLKLIKLESILLGDYLARFDNTLYTQQALVGNVDVSNAGLQKRNNRIFIRYDNLKNVMEWDTDEFIQKSKYKFDSTEHVQVALTTDLLNNSNNNFKRFFYRQLKAANHKTAKGDRYLKKKINRFKKIPYHPSSTKISTFSSQTSLPKRNPSRSSSRISLSAFKSRKKSVSTLLRQRSFERANIDVNSVYGNERAAKIFQNGPNEKFPSSSSNDNLEFTNLSTLSFSQTPPRFVSQQVKNKKLGTARSLLREISSKKANALDQQKPLTSLEKQLNSNQKEFYPWQSNKSLSSSSVCYSPSMTPVNFTKLRPVGAKTDYTEFPKAAQEEEPDNQADADPEYDFISLYDSRSALSITYDKSKYYAYSKFSDDAG